MLNVIFSLDYEIHGNGDGCPNELMVEPTNRLMDLFDRHGARLTIMADVAEILKFGEYRNESGRDDYYYDAIVAQLRDAVRRGHDVQLHLHCSYFNARHENGKWQQDWSEYNFAGLSCERISEVLRIGKSFLEKQLRPVDPNYRCYAFRAANWAVSPSRNVVRALVDNDFEIESSVFKYGRRTGLVNFDYSSAPSDLVPWLAGEEDICRRNDSSELLEVPIYSEARYLPAFVSPNRLYRAWSSRAHRLDYSGNGEISPRPSRWSKLSSAFRRHAWKADFNQCTGRQLIGALKRAAATHDHDGRALPFVLIGHSKLFTRQNEKSLQPFLRFVESKPAAFRFSTYGTSRNRKPHLAVETATAATV